MSVLLLRYARVLVVALLLVACVPWGAVLGEEEPIVGIVLDNVFHLLLPCQPHGRGPIRTHARLTSLPRMSALAPQSRELDLTLLEGKAIVVHGGPHLDEGWIYAACVEGVAAPGFNEWFLEYFQKWSAQYAFPDAPVPVPYLAASPITISEIEMNPEGNDRGKEWVELCNTSSEMVPLAGWEISYTEGCSKPCACWEQLPAVELGPGEYYVHVFDEERLHNSGWEICLRNVTGMLMARSLPGLEDIADSSKTWQKQEYVDGWGNENWLFTESTKGKPN